jgi:hypothetical protein
MRFFLIKGFRVDFGDLGDVIRGYRRCGGQKYQVFAYKGLFSTLHGHTSSQSPQRPQCLPDRFVGVWFFRILLIIILGGLFGAYPILLK